MQQPQDRPLRNALGLKVFEASQDIYCWLAPSGRLLDANDTLILDTGHDLHAGQALYLWDIAVFFSREAWPRFWETLSQESFQQLESPLRSKEGRLIPYALSLYHIADPSAGCLMVARDISAMHRLLMDFAQQQDSLRDQVKDQTAELSAKAALLEYEITQRVQMEETLRQSNHYIQSIHNMMDTGLVVLEQHSGRIADANGAAEGLLGVGPGELLGKPWPEIAHMHPAQLGDLLPPAGGQHIRLDWQFSLKSGGDRWVTLTCAEMSQRGQLLLMLRGIDDDREAHLMLARAAKEAQALAETRARFSAAMSHEVRTPLNAIAGLANLLLRTSLDARQQTYVRQLLDASSSLSAIVNDVLDFSRLNEHKVSLEITEFDFHEVLDRALSLVAPQAGNKGLELAYTELMPLPERLRGDPTRLLQILLNLLSNAVKFTAKGRIEIESVFFHQPKPRLQFNVRDTGIGMTPPEMARVFDPYTQADNSTARRFGGSGLGLSICRMLTELMGGNIVVHSVSGQGSQFTVTLPLTAVECATPPMPPGQAILCFPPHRNASLDALHRYLGQWGWQLTRHDTAGAAWTALRGAPNPPLLFIHTDLLSQLPLIGAPPHLLARLILVPAHPQALTLPPLVDGAPLLTPPVTPRRLAKVVEARLQPTVPQPQSERLKGFHILLAEDNLANQEIFATLLQDEGAQVTPALNGQQVLTAVSHQTQAFDVILMDVNMPEMDGLEATRQLRQRDSQPRLCIVGLTAIAEESGLRTCLEAGMDAVVSKPVDMDTLVATVLRLHPDAQTRPDLPALPPAAAMISSAPTLRWDWPGLKLRLRSREAPLRKALLGVLEHKQDRQRLHQLINDGHLGEAALLVHSLKGMAGVMLAHGLRQATQGLEKALKQTPPDELMLPQYRDQVLEELAHLCQSIEDLLADPAGLISASMAETPITE